MPAPAKAGLPVSLSPAEAVVLLGQRMDGRAARVLRPRVVSGLPLLVADLPAPFTAAFSTRHGGTSPAPWQSLNLSPRVDDGDEHAAANRAWFAQAVAALGGPEGDPAATLLSPLQVHGTRCVGAAEQRARPDLACDGLIMHPELDAGLVPLLLFADCVPVVLVGDVDAAVVHAGWRGLLGGVLQEAARAMTGPPGAAIIGPSIGPCCYRVGADLAADFARRYGADVALPGPRVDLWRAAAVALAEVHVSPARVTNPRLCTACNHDLFFSHRRGGPTTGRHGVAIWAGRAGRC